MLLLLFGVFAIFGFFVLLGFFSLLGFLGIFGFFGLFRFLGFPGLFGFFRFLRFLGFPGLLGFLLGLFALLLRSLFLGLLLFRSLFFGNLLFGFFLRFFFRFNGLILILFLGLFVLVFLPESFGLLDVPVGSVREVGTAAERPGRSARAGRCTRSPQGAGHGADRRRRRFAVGIAVLVGPAVCHRRIAHYLPVFIPGIGVILTGGVRAVLEILII